MSATVAMRLEGPSDQAVEDELDVMAALLPLAGARVLELGCGAAEKTRRIALESGAADVVAAEVDPIQHEKNLARDDLPGVSFVSYGAEAIDEPDASFDIVVMFKSLHHVPLARLDDALAEIRRVLVPGGLAYLSEPVFAGEFNEVLRLFHDESVVRREAFAAVRRAVDHGLFELAAERFFMTLLRLDSFEQFRRGVIETTHTQHRLDDELLARVQARFQACGGPEGYVFHIPNRVDVLRKPA